jgi:hypothetical protein
MACSTPHNTLLVWELNSINPLISYTYRDLLAENLFNIFSFVSRLLFPTNQIVRIVSSRVRKTIRPIRSRVQAGSFNMWANQYVQSEAISFLVKWLLFTELRNLGIYIINKKHHGKCFVQTVYRAHFPWSNFYLFYYARLWDHTPASQSGQLSPSIGKTIIWEKSKKLITNHMVGFVCLTSSKYLQEVVRTITLAFFKIEIFKLQNLLVIWFSIPAAFNPIWILSGVGWGRNGSLFSGNTYVLAICEVKYILDSNQSEELLKPSVRLQVR